MLAEGSNWCLGGCSDPIGLNRQPGVAVVFDESRTGPWRGNRDDDELRYMGRSGGVFE